MPVLSRHSQENSARSEAERPSLTSANLPTIQLSRNDEILLTRSLDVPRILIGRTDENELSIPSRYVSRHHILLFRHEEATILLDLNSTNGTFVNNKRVFSHVLAHDDVISVDIHSMFVQYNVRYSDPSQTSRPRLGDIESYDAVIEKALADISRELGKGETDLLPQLSENVPTQLGCIDDR